VKLRASTHRSSLIAHRFLLAVLSASAIPSRSALAADTAPVTVQTRVEPGRVHIGTPFRYTMVVKANEDVELVVPILAERIGEFSIQDFGEVPHEPREGRVEVERWYDLVTYEAGDHIVPGPTVQYRVAGSDLQRVDAPDALIMVESLLGSDATDIRDVKPPADPPRDYRVLWWAAGGLLGLATLGFLLHRLLNRPRRAAAPPPRPAHEVALEGLTRLRAAGLLESGRHAEFFVRLSDVVRAYLEARFGLRAPEMTTEEFLQAAQHAKQLSTESRSLLAGFLTEADLVKFARHVPGTDDAERAHEAARRFVESTAEAAVSDDGGRRAAA
jgi:hypothetical protein